MKTQMSITILTLLLISTTALAAPQKIDVNSTFQMQKSKYAVEGTLELQYERSKKVKYIGMLKVQELIKNHGLEDRRGELVLRKKRNGWKLVFFSDLTNGDYLHGEVKNLNLDNILDQTNKGFGVRLVRDNTWFPGSDILTDTWIMDDRGDFEITLSE